MLVLDISEGKAAIMRVYHQLTMQRLMGLILFILLFTMAARVPTDTDTWWHLRSGQVMVDEHTILRHDRFSHTRQGEAWINHSWGAQIILYGVYELFGGGTRPGATGNIGLSLFTAALATAGMGLVYAMCAGNVYVRAFAVVLGAATAAVFWAPRPQMFSFVLAAGILYLLHLYKRRHIDRLWLIPALVLVWANLHGGFAMAFILLLGTLFGEALANLAGDRRPDVLRGARLRKLVMVTAVSVPAVAINPYGIRMLAYPFETVSIGALQDFIQEWAAPDFHLPQTWPFLVMLLALLAVFATSKERVDWTDLVLVSGSAAMALMAGRNIALFAVVATPVLSRQADAWLAERGWRLRPRRTVSRGMLLVNWALLVLVSMGALAKVGTTLSERTIRQAQEEFFPAQLADYLQQTLPAGRLFNSYNWGGYLIFAAPQVPVFVDGRTDLYGDELLQKYLEVILLRDGWQQTLDEYGIDRVAIESDSTLAGALRLLSTRWHELQFDEGRSALFVREAGG